MLYNGQNNGSVYLGVHDAAHRIGVADHHTASRAFDELQKRGFIEMTQDAHFRVKAAEGTRARTWRLTWEPGPGKRVSGWVFMEREPEPKTLERRRMERGLRALKTYRQARDCDKFPVVDSTMQIPGNGGKPFMPCMVNSHHHTASTMGSAAPAARIGWWEPDWSTWAALSMFASMIGQLGQVASVPGGWVS